MLRAAVAASVAGNGEGRAPRISNYGEHLPAAPGEGPDAHLGIVNTVRLAGGRRDLLVCLQSPGALGLEKLDAPLPRFQAPPVLLCARQTSVGDPELEDAKWSTPLTYSQRPGGGDTGEGPGHLRTHPRKNGAQAEEEGGGGEEGRGGREEGGTGGCSGAPHGPRVCG